MSFDKYIHLWCATITTIMIQSIFITPKVSCSFPVNPLLSRPGLQFTCFLSLYVSLFQSFVSMEPMESSMCIFYLTLAQHNVFEIHPYYGGYQQVVSCGFFFFTDAFHHFEEIPLLANFSKSYQEWTVDFVKCVFCTF